LTRLYSYIRFSTAEQADGSSSTRQAEYAAKYALDNGLVLDESLSMRDEGLSAYHQTHIKKGALGVFLRAVEDGLVPEGSTLIIEALDRLSRAEPIVSQALLSQIVNAGITVVTASDGKHYDRESLRANPMDLVYSLLVLIRAHEESDTKSKRVNAALRIACEDWISGKKRSHVRNGRAPAWFRETGSAEPPLFEFIPDRVEVLRVAIRLYIDGYGVQQIQQRLKEAGLQFTDKPLVKTHFHKIVKREDLAGTKIIKVDGEEYRLEDYYPRVLDDAEYQLLQSRLRSRVRSPASNIPGVITGVGVCFCGYCSSSMAGINNISRARADGSLSDGSRRLICNAANGVGGCPVPSSCSISPVERAILNYCADQMSLSELVNTSNEFESVRAKQLKVEADLAKAKAQVDKLTDALLQTDTPPLALMRKQREIEDSIVVMEAKRESLAQQLRVDGAKVNNDLLNEWHSLSGLVLGLDLDARVKVRDLVVRTFERIEVYVRGYSANQEGIAGRIAVEVFEKKLGVGSQIGSAKINEKNGPIDLVLKFRSGAVRLLRIDRKSGAWQAQVDF
jgi:DNA invertase Pin-like site-specific DNA recombinase